VVFDRSDAEPEEYDPEAEYRDPDSDSLSIPEVEEPSVEIPEVEIPDVEVDESEVPREIRRAFWSTVLVVNAAVLASSLGVMFLIFRGELRRAAVLVAGGVILFAMAYRRYRLFEAEHGERSETTSTDERVAGDETGELDEP